MSALRLVHANQCSRIEVRTHILHILQSNYYWLHRQSHAFCTQLVHMYVRMYVCIYVCTYVRCCLSSSPFVSLCLPSLRWVYMATKHGRRVPECDHAVGGTVPVSEPLKQSSVTTDKTNSKDLSSENKELITPFRSLQPKLNTRVSWYA